MNVLIDNDLDLRVFLIPGKDNIITDPLSRFCNNLAVQLAPRFSIFNFEHTPSGCTGGLQKNDSYLTDVPATFQATVDNGASQPRALHSTWDGH